MNRPPALIFGVPITDVTMDEAIDLVVDLVAHGRATGRVHQIATVNVDFLVNALDDPGLIDILQRSTACVADGMPVVWGCRGLGMPLRERVAGADLVPELIQATQHTDFHVHVFGSAPEVADAAREVLTERYPSARFSIDPGPIIPDVEHVDDEVLESIVAVDADVVCVALGNPKQERFIRAHRDRIGAPVMIGVGGSLDMLVGKRRRAPAWVQRMGMEWVVRAAQEPRRLGRRYAHDIRVFGPHFVSAWRASRRRRHGLGMQIATNGGGIEVVLTGHEAADPADWSRAATTLLDGGDLVIDVAAGAVIRDDAAAQLVGLVYLARRTSGDVVWRRSPDDLMPSFGAIGLQPAMLGLESG